MQVRVFTTGANTRPPYGETTHDFDDDAVCRVCGFDGAEWWHLEKLKPSHERDPQPICQNS